MQKRRHPDCLDCEEGYTDTPGHALFDCMAWITLRFKFRDTFGVERNLRDIIGKISMDLDKWRIFVRYAGEVIRRKAKGRVGAGER